jgi:6,7-dimethyl-8-ribityllumazine synthase
MAPRKSSRRRGRSLAGEMNASDLIDASEYQFAVVVARFNGDVTERLLHGAINCFKEHGGPQVDTYHVPGAFELPLAARMLAETDVYDAIVCLGAVIRGDTSHYEFVAGEAARGIARATYDTGVPVAFGVLTTENQAQADARSGPGHENKGWEAARTAIEMAVFIEEIPEPEE